MFYLINASLIFGLAAWILPYFAFKQYTKSNYRKGNLFCITSICSCIISLYIVILDTNQKLKYDIPGLLDTYSVLTFVSTVLVIVTIFLNLFILIAFNNIALNKN